MLPGAIYFTAQEVPRLLNGLAEQLRAGADPATKLSTKDLGKFSLRQCHASWPKLLMLGALDYYRVESIAARQVLPDARRWTCDIPDSATTARPHHSRFACTPISRRAMKQDDIVCLTTARQRALLVAEPPPVAYLLSSPNAAEDPC